MAIKLTDEQLSAVKGMVEFAENMADQFMKIMEDHELDKVKGCRLTVTVIPSLLLTNKKVEVGFPDTDFGCITLTKGRKDEKFAATGTNSTEYELLFADEALRSRMEKVLHREKPLPPDGLWVGDDRNDPPVDCGEWDLNDSLS